MTGDKVSCPIVMLLGARASTLRYQSAVMRYNASTDGTEHDGTYTVTLTRSA